MRGRMITIMVAMGVLAGGVTTGFAAEPRGWQFEISPYLWLAGLEGDVEINGQSADFEKSASDLLDYVEVGGSLLGVVQYNRFLFWGQVDYFSLSTDSLEVDDRPEHGKIDSKMLLGEAAVGYQINGWAEGQTFDLLVGARILRMENDLEVYGLGTYSQNETLTDPILVVRPSFPLFPSKIKGLRFNPTLAIGGGGDSDLVYELFPQVQYQITKNLAARFGYRTIGYKITEGDDELNFNMAGLVLGLGATF